MDAALLFKLFSNRDKLARLGELVAPAIEAIKPNLAEITSIGTELAAILFPDFGRKTAAKNPLATFDVKWLQTSLNVLGQKITVDGDYGDATRKAVTAFQATHNLTPDGWSAIETCSAIIVELDKLGDKK